MYRVFLSSPADVLSERNRAQAVIERLNGENAGGAIFALTRWEESFYTAADHFQAQIAEPGEHDLVVCIFWKRLGTELPSAYNRADGTSRTGTEFEFEVARDARERRGDNLPDILVYRKTAKVLFSEETLEMERAQKKALDQFWERWFRSDTGHYIAGFQSFSDPGDFDRQFESNLRNWLRRRQAGHAVWDIGRQGSPYRGLAPFEEGHSDLFYGREHDLSRARARFIEAAVGPDSGRRGTPLLLIFGASGSGKSSFMRAGLVPRMRVAGAPALLEDGSDGIGAFRTLIVTPRELGDALCAGLATALYHAGTGNQREVGLPELSQGDYVTPEAFAALASSSPQSAKAPVLRALDRLMDGSGHTAESSSGRIGLLLAIDQLEELFARDESDRRSFVRMLAAFAETGRVWLVATMRNDFYDRLREDPELSALVDRGRIYDLAPPTLADYRDIIRRPAQAAGLRFETDGHRDLAADIEADAGGEGALPMVAFLLEQLFQERRGELLTFETYDRLGGAAGALAELGEEVVLALPAPVREAFPRIVRRLVRKSLQDLVPTAASAFLQSFPTGSPERELIAALGQARLLTTFTVAAVGNVPASTRVRWSHEALLTRWPRLRNAVDADRRDYETLDRIRSAHSLWQGTPLPQRNERLLTDLALAEAIDLLSRWGADVEPPSQEFVEASASRARVRRRRQRQIVTATVAALSILLVAVTITSVIATKQRNLALVEQGSADRTVRFMVSLFKVADPGENRGSSVTVREVLDKGAADITKGLALEPAIRADLRTAMGEAYLGLGLYDNAAVLLRAARVDEGLASTAAESRLRTQVALGNTLYYEGEYEEAEKLLRPTVEAARRVLPRVDPLRSEALDTLANVLAQQDKIPEAEQLCLEALAADRKRGPDQATTLADTLDVLGSVYYSKGDLPAAERTMREALALHEQISGLKDVTTAIAMNNLAAVLYVSGRYDENISVLNQALPIYKQVYGEEHPEVAILFNNMGRSMLMAGHIQESVPMFRQALALHEKLRGPNHNYLVAPLNSLAMIDAYAGRTSDAQAEIKRAEQIARLPDHGELLDQVLVNRADLDVRAKDLDRAAAALQESRRLLETAYPLATRPSEKWRYAVWDTVNAEVLARHGDQQGARRLIESAAPVIVQRFGETGFYTLLAKSRAQFVQAGTG